MRNLRPLLFLAGLSPCVEFLTGSTSFIQVVTNFPTTGALFLLLTVPGYAFPAWLFREALVTWKKGLPSLLALAVSYGAFNEGLLAKTYFTINTLSPSLGPGGGAGDWIGVNWPWVTGITLFHMVVSMGVPVALCFLIFPETKTERFLSDRSIRWLLGYLAAEVGVVLAIESLFSAAIRGILPLILIPTAILLAGVFLARRLPVPSPNRAVPGRLGRPFPLALASFGFFVVTFLPILQLFPIPFVPTYAVIWVFGKIEGPYGLVVTLYPLLMLALAIRFFSRYAPTNLQLLSIVAGVMFLPLVGAIAVLSFPQGATIAAGIYIVAIWWAGNRSKKAHDEEAPAAITPSPAA